jgi:hypothetical protein
VKKKKRKNTPPNNRKKPTGKKAVPKSKPRPSPEFRIARTDIDKIAHSLGVAAQDFGNHYRMYLQNPAEGRKLTLEIYPDIPIGSRQGTLITVYTPTAHLQLHFCSGYVISEMLGEVTFVGIENGKMSGLIIEKGAACSLYANVDNDLLSGDITTLGPEVMLSGIALSLTESLVKP